MVEETIPPGTWKNAQGAFVPVSKIDPIDKARTRVVDELIASAKAESVRIAEFKVITMAAVQEFIDRSLAEFGVKRRGQRGNTTLTNFQGTRKVVVQIQDTLVFDERLLAAKALIDECIQAWGKGSNANLRVLVNDAFQVDKEGKISTGRVLGLRRHKISDEKWQEAMRAINASVQIASSKPLIRFYERDEAGAWVAIPLDVAAV